LVLLNPGSAAEENNSAQARNEALINGRENLKETIFIVYYFYTKYKSFLNY